MPFTKSTDISNATVFSGSPINTRINNSETYLDLYDDDIESIRLGWIPVTIAGVAETWTYNSVSGILGTITVASDATTRFQKGDKIRFVQSSTTKYFYITAVTATTITVTGGTDYTLTNSAISSIFLSRIENPFGFPDWFSYTPTLSGETTSPTYTANYINRFKIYSNSINTYHQWSNASGGTAGSGGNGLVISLPVAMNSSFAFANPQNVIGFGSYFKTGDTQFVSVQPVSTTTIYLRKESGIALTASDQDQTVRRVGFQTTYSL